MITLIFCARSPSTIGALVWREHPTLQAIMKMVTTQRFRFPTVDCDESEALEMKRLDRAAREKVRASSIKNSCSF
jgi:DNA-binding transcriptional MocR family regulator